MFCIDSSKQLLRNKTKHNIVRRKQLKPPTKKHHWLLRTTSAWQSKLPTARKKILTWDENKTQTDGSPKTNGRDIRSAKRRNEADLSRRARTSVPPGTEISPGAPPETIRFRVASAQHQCGSSSRISSRQADSVLPGLQPSALVTAPDYSRRVDRAPTYKQRSQNWLGGYPQVSGNLFWLPELSKIVTTQTHMLTSTLGRNLDNRAVPTCVVHLEPLFPRYVQQLLS